MDVVMTDLESTAQNCRHRPAANDTRSATERHAVVSRLASGVLWRHRRMYARHSNTLTFTCKPNRYSTSKAAVFLTFIGFLMYCAYCRVRICKKLASVIGCCALFCSCCYACGIASKMNESCLVPTCLEATGVMAMRIKLRTAYGIQVSDRVERIRHTRHAHMCVAAAGVWRF